MTNTRFPIAALAALLLAQAASLAAPAPTAPPEAGGTNPVQAPAAPSTGSSLAPGADAARALWQQGDIDAALVALKTTLRGNPLDQDALLLLAELQLVRMDGAAAETTLRRALDAQVPRAEVVVPLARALLLQGKPRAVLDELAPSADLNGPTRARLLSQHAAARIALGEPEQAAALLEQAAAAAPAVPEPDLLRAVLALQRGAADDALAAVEQALGMAPDTYEAWMLKGDIARARGDLPAAEAAFGEAIARSPNRWLAAYSRAVARLDQGSVDGAEADIALAQAQFPEFVGLAYARGRVDLMRQRPTEAAAAFERYLGAIPADANALFYAAFAANQLGNREQALEYLRRLEAVEGASTRLLWLKARTLLAAGDAPSAEALLREPLAGPAPAPELALLAQEALVRQSRNEDALELVQRALAAHPDDAQLHAAETRLRFATGERDAAEASARQVLERDPKDIEALLVVTQAAALRGEAVPELLARLREAKARAPTDPRIPTLIGELHAAAGELSDACASLADALRIDPGANAVVGRLQRLGCAAREPALMQGLYQNLLATHPEAVKTLPALLAMNPGEDDAQAGLAKLRQALAADPKNAELRASLVAALLRLGRAGDAAEALAEVPPEQLGDPRILRVTGLLALSRDDAAAAVRAFDELLAAEPGADAAYLLAEAEARAGDLSAARYQLTEGLRREPEHPLAAAVAARILGADESIPARRQLIDDIRRVAPDAPMIPLLQAQTLLDAGRPDKAAELYQTIHAREPDNAAVFGRVLLALQQAGQSDQALALAEPWLAAHPDQPGIALIAGDLHAVSDRKQQAGAWYRHALDLAPDNLMALNNLAVVLTDSDPAEAVALAARAYAQAPKNPQVQDTYGAALLAAGDAGKARKLLTEAYGLSGQDPGIGLNLARSLAAAGEPERAREILRLLLQTDFPAQAEARALMQELRAR